MTFALYALALLTLAGLCAYTFDQLFADLATSREGGALRWVAVPPSLGAAVTEPDGRRECRPCKARRQREWLTKQAAA